MPHGPGLRNLRVFFGPTPRKSRRTAPAMRRGGPREVAASRAPGRCAWRGTSSWSTQCRSVARRLLVRHRALDRRPRDGPAANAHAVLLADAVLEGGSGEREAAVGADLRSPAPARRSRAHESLWLKLRHLAAAHVEGRHDHVVPALGVVPVPRRDGRGGGGHDAREQDGGCRHGGTSSCTCESFRSKGENALAALPLAASGADRLCGGGEPTVARRFPALARGPRRARGCSDGGERPDRGRPRRLPPTARGALERDGWTSSARR